MSFPKLTKSTDHDFKNSKIHLTYFAIFCRLKPICFGEKKMIWRGLLCVCLLAIFFSEKRTSLVSGLPSQLKRNFPAENLILEPELTGLKVETADVESLNDFSETGNVRIPRFKRQDDDDAGDDDEADGDGELEELVA